MANDLTNWAADGIEAAVRRCTVGIITGSGAQKWKGIGTGTLVRWLGCHLILTADHVLGRTDRSDLRFLFPHEAPPIPVERETLLSLDGMLTSQLQPFTEIELGGIFRDPELDLAAIEVDVSLEATCPARFFDLVHGGSSPGERQTTILIGYPHDLSRVTKNDARVLFTQVEWSEVEPPRSDLPKFDHKLHFLAAYSPPATYPEANPHGLSGSGVWARRGDTPEVWHPNLDLGGVTITYYPSAQLMKIVRREMVERFLRELAA